MSSSSRLVASLTPQQGNHVSLASCIFPPWWMQRLSFNMCILPFSLVSVDRGRRAGIEKTGVQTSAFPSVVSDLIGQGKETTTGYALWYDPI